MIRAKFGDKIWRKVGAGTLRSCVVLVRRCLTCCLPPLTLAHTSRIMYEIVVVICELERFDFPKHLNGVDFIVVAPERIWDRRGRGMREVLVVED
jgi:hypothetical protein